MTQVVHLRGKYQRELSKQLIDKAPDNAVVRISPERRSDDQNAKMWAMISDVSRAKPEGRVHIPEVWKCIFMAACGHEVAFENGLDVSPFPIVCHSSKWTKAQMSDLIEFIYSWGAKYNIKWSDDNYE